MSRFYDREINHSKVLVYQQVALLFACFWCQFLLVLNHVRPQDVIKAHFVCAGRIFLRCFGP